MPTTINSADDQCFSSQVIVAPSSLVLNGNIQNIGDGAFAKVDIKKGDLVEKGVARQMPIDGNKWEMVFTWSDDRTKWATCTGHAAFYNTSMQPNTNMTRAFDMFENGSKLAVYQIHATRDIKAGEALTHTYKSLQWRKKFEEIKDSVDCVEFPPLVAPLPESKVQCDGIVVKDFKAYAAVEYKEGDVIECGVFRYRPGKIDNFTDELALWRVPPVEKDNGEEKWALLSGKAMMLTAKKEGEAVNTRFEFTREDWCGSFKLIATRNIAAGEELSVFRLTHNRPVAMGA